jgi:hypothetical protein
MGEYFGGWRYGDLASLEVESFGLIAITFALIGLGQYRAVFVENRKPGWLVSFVLLGAGFFSAMFCWISLTKFQNEIFFIAMRDSILSALSCVVSLATSILNFRLRRTMRRIELATDLKIPPQRGQWQFSLTNLFAMMAFFGVLLSVGLYSYNQSIPRFAEHATIDRAPRGIPKNATDITYRVGFRGSKIFMFTIDEASLRTWISSRGGTNLQEIELPHSMQNFTNFFQQPVKNIPTEITNGLLYVWTSSDQIVYVAFDRDNNRAYFYNQWH